MIISNFIGYALVALSVLLSIASGKIDTKGGLVGGLIASLLFYAEGYLGILLIAVFFTVGTSASLYKIRTKARLKLAEGQSGRRGWRNVLSNSGAAGLVALLDVLAPNIVAEDGLLMASCFAVALSDTLSSELGNVTGKRYYDILNWQTASRGQDGVVSLEGTFWGLLGSLIIAGMYAAWRETVGQASMVAILGMVGNIGDSLLGATLQRRGILSNHGVNFMSTMSATAIAYLIISW